MAKSSDSDGNARSGFRREIEKAYSEMLAIRRAYYKEATDGGVSLDIRQMLAAQARAYYDVLDEYKEKTSRAKELWGDSNVDQIPQLHNSTINVETEAVGDSPSSTYTKRNGLVAQNPEDVIQLTKQLDDIRNALSFAAGVEDETHNDSPDHSDLVELAQIKGQEDTLDKIPSGES